MHRFVFAVLCATGVALPCAAMTYVMVSDEDLARTADAIVVGRVLEVEQSTAGARPRTVYSVEVERVLRGSVPDPTISMSLPGGPNGDGLALVLDELPRLQVGDRTILFLVANGDLTFSPLHLLLGVFREEPAGGRTLAVRDLSAGTEIVPRDRASVSADARQPRDFERFAAWLAAAGTIPADYRAGSPSTPRTVRADHAFLNSKGIRFRWSEFQLGSSIPWSVAVSEDSDLDELNVENARRAIAAWNDEPGTLISYELTGRSSANGGFSRFDGVNSILFGDPGNEVAGRFSCIGGGVLALGGPWTDTRIRTQYRGQEVIPIAGADIILNDGLECLTQRAAPFDLQFEEVLGHELGHTLGLAHACDGFTTPCTDPLLDEALMRAQAHLDQRGAKLAPDDITAIETIYTRTGPALRWSHEPVRPSPGDPVNFLPSDVPQGATFEWDFGDGSPASSLPSPTHAFQTRGLYEVRLLATDATGTHEVTSWVIVGGGRLRAVRH